MEIKPKNTTAVVLAALGGALLLAAGARIAYIETARATMEDCDRKIDEAINNPVLKASWAKKLETIEAKKQKHLDGNKDWCKNPEEQQPSNLPSGTYLADPHWFCNESQLLLLEHLEKEFNAEALELGSYDQWAVKQAGIDKWHPWNRYPKELSQRLRMGERGLMLGPFWKFIL
ncbi:MAG: hypothetical protein FJ053_03020 [Cyanobacteria bacterium M_surface_10_m1_298]|nr:hypothetical protein [Cyanobacteria bacterium M_surface_10_m1_298]